MVPSSFDSLLPNLAASLSYHNRCQQRTHQARRRHPQVLRQGTRLIALLLMYMLTEAAGQDSVEDIIVALEREGSEWATHTRNALSKLSPTALKVVFRQLHHGKQLPLNKCFEMEFRMAQRFMVLHSSVCFTLHSVDHMCAIAENSSCAGRT